MTLTLRGAIEQCPDTMFGNKDKGEAPKFCKIFARVAKALLKAGGEEFDEATVDLVAQYVNPSSLQRAVADHRATITGLIDRETGKYLPVAEKLPKKERGQPRPKATSKGDEDDLGLGTSKPKKAGKKSAKVPKKPAKVVKEAATVQDTRRDKAAPEKPSKKAEAAAKDAATSPKDATPGLAEMGGKLKALAAARAALAAKKAKGGQTTNNTSKKPTPAEASVEI